MTQFLSKMNSCYVTTKYNNRMSLESRLYEIHDSDSKKQSKTQFLSESLNQHYRSYSSEKRIHLCAQEMQLADKDARINQLLFQNKILSQANNVQIIDLKNKLSVCKDQKQRLKREMEAFYIQKEQYEKQMESYSTKIKHLQQLVSLKKKQSYEPQKNFSHIKQIFRSSQKEQKENTYVQARQESCFNKVHRQEISEEQQLCRQQNMSENKSFQYSKQLKLLQNRYEIFVVQSKKQIQKHLVKNQQLRQTIHFTEIEFQRFSNKIAEVLRFYGNKITEKLNKNELIIMLQNTFKKLAKNMQDTSRENQILKTKAKQSQKKTKQAETKFSQLVEIIDGSNRKVSELMGQLRVNKQQLQSVKILYQNQKQQTQFLRDEIKKVSINSEHPLIMSSIKKNEIFKKNKSALFSENKPDPKIYQPSISKEKLTLEQRKDFQQKQLLALNQGYKLEIQQLRYELKDCYDQLQNSQELMQQYRKSVHHIFDKAQQIDQEIRNGENSEIMSKYERSNSIISPKASNNKQIENSEM